MILVVDNDPDVLEKAHDILNHSRLVFLASNANQAIAMVERLGFSVVLVDMDLPGSNALIKQLHDAHPELSFIAIHGTVEASLLESAEDKPLAASRAFFRSRADMALEVLALRQQLGVLKRKRPRTPLNSLDLRYVYPKPGLHGLSQNWGGCDRRFGYRRDHTSDRLCENVSLPSRFRRGVQGEAPRPKFQS